MSAILSVRSLTLSHFRNYAHARLSLEPQPIVLTGHNGAGKTNLLEAVSFLIPGRGLRRAKVAEVDAAGSGQPWGLSAVVEGVLGEVRIGTGRDVSVAEDSDKRVARIDGKPVRAIAELAEHMAVAWLTPQMDQLFNDSGSARRRFLDRLVYGFEPAHATRVSAYEYAMRERNRLLSQRSYDPAWVAALERKMAEAGVAIASARLEACAHLNAVMEESALAFPKASLRAEGAVERMLAEGRRAVEAEALCQETLATGRREDAASGRTLFGAHRTELCGPHLAKNMEAANCSTGEQKALLLSIVLAELKAGSRWHGRVPVLLLDEVAAHLDADKRRELFEEILDARAQVWMTGTDVHLFEGLRGKAQFFEVEGGKAECH